MEEEIDFYLLTINKDNQLYANVYEDMKLLKEAIRFFEQKYPIKLFALAKTSGKKYDLALARKDDSFVVCLGPKIELSDSTKGIIKCRKKEIIFKDSIFSDNY